MANPFDQFDSAHAASGGNPFDQFDAKPASAKTASSPSATLGGFTASNPATWALAGLDSAGMGLGTKNPFMAMPDQFKQDVAAAHEGLGWMDYPLGAAAYAVGPGKILGPAGKAISEAGSALPGIAGRIAGTPMIAEGALAGGASSAIADPTNLTGIATGAATGGALGAAAHGLTKGANAGLSKFFGKEGSIDPQTAIAATKAARDEAYAPLKNIAFNPDDVLNAHTSVTLTPGMGADVTSGMENMLAKQRNAIQNGGNTANDIADYMTNLKSVSGSPSASNGDKLLAGQTASNLSDLLTNANPITDHAPGEAAQTLEQAQTAHQQYMMAQNLAEWQRRESVGASVGQAPLTEAEKYYQGPDALQNYKTLTDLYQKSQDSTSKLSWALGHMGAHAIGAAGGMMAGWPGEFIGEGLGYLFAKPAINKALKGYDKTQLLKAYQQAYPQLTGQQLLGAQPGPEVGDAIKNIMLGSAY
jgi:hypothetical protein